MNHYHDEPAKGPVSRDEYEYALEQLRGFQQQIARRYAENETTPITLESIEIDWANTRDKLGYSLTTEQVDWLINRIHELEKNQSASHSQIAAAIRKGISTGLGWRLDADQSDWLNANQHEHDEIAEAIERFEPRGASPFDWNLYLSNSED